MKDCSFLGAMVQKLHEKAALKRGDLIRCNHCGNITDKVAKYCPCCGKSTKRKYS